MITTSYFAVSRNLGGTKISVARYNPPRITGKIEVQNSFAPSGELLKKYRGGKVDWAKYKEIYANEQGEHYRESPKDFENLLERAVEGDLVLLCYERYEGLKTKCHRLLLVDILKEISKERKYKVDFVDEIFYEKKG